MHYFKLLRKPFEQVSTDLRSVPKNIVVIFQIIILGGVSTLLAALGINPGIVGLFLIVGVVTFWSQPRFVIALIPFLFLLAVYTHLRNIANLVTSQPLHVTELIEWEQALFGDILPTVRMQNLVIGSVFEPVVNLAAALIYISFFWVPLAVGYLLWRKSPYQYWFFIGGLLCLSFTGYACYYLYPAAPPWWANYYGYLNADNQLPNPHLLNAELLLKTPNPVAAMPSLHAAYPTYVAGMCLFFWGRRAKFMLWLPLLISLSAVYLGHHYIVDILAGFALGIVWIGITVWIYLKFVKSTLSSKLTAN